MPENNEPSMKRYLLELIGTLNESFPDYDFARTKHSQFVVQDAATVIRRVNTNLNDLAGRQVAGGRFLDKLWGTVDEAMNIRKCDIFSYVSDMDGDPFSDSGCLWSFNYFFVSQELKQILFFSCVATSKGGGGGGGSDGGRPRQGRDGGGVGDFSGLESSGDSGADGDSDSDEDGYGGGGGSHLRGDSEDGEEEQFW